MTEPATSTQTPNGQTGAVTQGNPAVDVIDQVSGYQDLTLLVNGATSRIYRALRSSDEAPVILKIVREDTLTRENIARHQHEYDMLNSLSSDHVIRALALTRSTHNCPVLVMEDIGGESLDRMFREHRPDPEKLLHILMLVVKGLADIHKAGLVHKDINPSNLVFNHSTGQLRIIDFGISTNLKRELAKADTANLVPGTHPYLAPEQTGRMNRTVDYRADYYALGATLYELLTGRLMFLVTEPIEWFHCHIARRPTPPSELVRGVPPALSDITMRLLEKNAENRYQSAHGLLADLQTCQQRLQNNQALTSFPLAGTDVPERFRLPQKLYGREDNLKQLMAAFDQAYDGMSLALVSGLSGTGKSSLINELYKPVTARKCYFIRGKFDQLHRDIPYSGLRSALRDLIRQLLTESPERVESWKQRILSALGSNARLMTDMMPELEAIIGPQPEVEPLPALESEQRFRLTLFSFFRVFSIAEHPLVLVMDDIQWADTSTLRLADLMVDQQEGERLLVVGAYRHNEITPDHPLVQLLGQLSKTNTTITQIRIEPLSEESLQQLLEDTLHTSAEDAAELTRLIHQKTGGNPFFVEEFLQEQHRQGGITFDQALGRWVWDRARLAQQQISENVADLMSHKIQRLSPAAGKLLQYAACVGNRFSLDLLTRLSRATPKVVAKALAEAVQEGLISPVRDTYQLTEVAQDDTRNQPLTVEFAFAHDRIQEAAYHLLPQPKRQKAHWAIGQLLLKDHEEARNDQLFTIVNHLNLAVDRIENDSQRLQLAQLNLAAAQRARQAASYGIAFNHCQKALALLGEGRRPWQEHYDLALALHTHGAETAAYVGDAKALKRYLEAGLEYSKNLLDRVPFHEVQISTCIARGELPKAVRISKEVLAELGHRYPKNPNKVHVALGFIKLQRRLRKYSMKELRELPPMTDPRQLAAARIGSRLGSAAMFSEPFLLTLMVFRGVEMCLDYGHTPEATTSLSIVGMIYAGELGKVDYGMDLGQVAMDVCSRLDRRHMYGRSLHLYASLIQHWKEPLTNTLPNLAEASRTCMENGDFEYAIHAANLQQEYLFLAGADLQEVQELTSSALARFRALQQGALLHHQDSRLQVTLNLRGLSDRPEKLSGFAYDLEAMLPKHRVAKDDALIDHVLLKRMYLQYLFDSGTEQLEDADHLAVSRSNIRGFYGASWTYFVCALVHLRAAQRHSGKARRNYLKRAIKDMKEIQKFSANSPENYLNKAALLEAELLRTKGDDFAAHNRFDEAINLSRQHGFLQDQALTNELCGQMHAEAGRLTLATPYLREARFLYHRWGALAKVRDLEKRFPQLTSDLAPSPSGGTTFTALDTVDITSLMKALKVIANEQIHSRMVSAVISTAIEFAGAQRGLLALRNNEGDLCIEAEMDVDGGDPVILQSLPLEECTTAAIQVLNYVGRTREGMVIDDAMTDNTTIPGLNMDPYVQANQIRSVLCLPITASSGGESELIGLLYLENNHMGSCFTASRFGALEIICMSAAGRLELSRKATIDGLTNLFNHDYFQSILRQEMSGVHRYQKDLSLLLIDIDHFKRFNDTWGHQLGDKVLREVADLIRQTCRDGDTAARYGGEEMAVILPGASLDDARIVGERIRKAIETHNITANGEQIHITVSLGLAVADHSVTDGAALIKKADMALYQSKANGRNQLTVG